MIRASVLGESRTTKVWKFPEEGKAKYFILLAGTPPAAMHVLCKLLVCPDAEGRVTSTRSDERSEAGGLVELPFRRILVSSEKDQGTLLLFSIFDGTRR